MLGLRRVAPRRLNGVVLRAAVTRPTSAPLHPKLDYAIALGIRPTRSVAWSAAQMSSIRPSSTNIWMQVTPSRLLPTNKWARYSPPAFSSRAALTPMNTTAPWVVALRRSTGSGSNGASSGSSAKVAASGKKEEEKNKEEETALTAEQPSIMDRGRSLWKAITEGAAHYWAGTKLLGTQVRIASRYVAKLTRGERLARRERKLLTRTVADLFRVVPFAVFILVPLGELLLPFYLRLFPQMLPSTFESSFEKEERLKKQLKARIEFAHFLQDTAEEMATDVISKRKGESKESAEDFVQFVHDVRQGKYVTPDALDRYAKLFRDEFTLDRVNRPQLSAMAQLLGIGHNGTNAWLRFQLRSRIQALKVDDRTIRQEGLDTMTLEELRAANISRGMRATGLKRAGLERQLSDWLELSLDRGIPTTLLILSRAFTLVGGVRTEEAIASTLSSMPEDVVEELEVQLGKDSNELKLEMLQKEAEAVADEVAEQAEFEASKAAERAELAAAAAAGDKKAAEALATSATADIAETLKESREALAESEAASAASAASVGTETAAEKKKKKKTTKSKKAKKKATDKTRTVNPVSDVLSPDQLEDLGRCVETLAGSSVIESERQRLEELQAEMNVLTQELGEEIDGNEHGARLGKRVANMLTKLQDQVDAVEQEIGDRFVKLDADGDGKLTVDELQKALTMIKDAPPASEVRALAESMDADRDGSVAVEELSEVSTPHEDKMGKIEDQAEAIDTELKKQLASLPPPTDAATAAATKPPATSN